MQSINFLVPFHHTESCIFSDFHRKYNLQLRRGFFPCFWQLIFLFSKQGQKTEDLHKVKKKKIIFGESCQRYFINQLSKICFIKVLFLGSHFPVCFPTLSPWMAYMWNVTYISYKNSLKAAPCITGFSFFFFFFWLSHSND